MTIQTACPHCDRVFTLTDDKVGKNARCKGCGKIFVIKPLKATQPAPKAKPSAVTVPPLRKKAAPPPPDEDDEVESSAVARSPVKKKAAPPPEDEDEMEQEPPADDDTDAEEDEERPARRPSRKPKSGKRRKKRSGPGALPWLLAGGGVLALLLIGGGIALFIILRGGGGAAAPQGGGPGPATAGTTGGPSGPIGSSAPQGGVIPVAHVTEEAFDQLRTGMTEDEVVAILGPPTSRVGPDKNTPPPPMRPGVVTEVDLVVMKWDSGKNHIEVMYDMYHKAGQGKAKFDDGHGGIKEVLGNRRDQLTGMVAGPSSEQVVWLWGPNGQPIPPASKPAAPPGPSHATFGKVAHIPDRNTTADAVQQQLGEPPTKKLGPQLMPTGVTSADAWEWDNGNGYYKIYIDADGKVIGAKNKDLPFQ